MSKEPDVPVPFPSKYGTPACPAKWCGYKCGCCCHCICQTPCPEPNEDIDFEPWCSHDCHGGHEPWDCEAWATRYTWAKAKSERLASQNE
jgi:hypothetical protein